MSAKDDLIVYAVMAAVAVAAVWYVKKKVGDAVDDVTAPLAEVWTAAANFGDGVWQTTAPALDSAVSHVTGYPGVYQPTMNYPQYLESANARRDAIAASYGPQIVGGQVSTSNPINDAFNGVYQSLFGSGRTLGSDIYDWTH